ncbi:UTRA domain-containing protein [Blautia sp. JLR.GB0024]|uniref:GntR family transcriptional regulator n=1 Tax=Blautia sp. JLR.GB0024 TaxID=3123295 RepID=UPI00300544A7
MSFSAACIANGRRPSSHIISCTVMDAENWQKEFLKIQDDSRLYHIERVLSADDLPIIYEHIYIPVSRVPDLQAERLEGGSFTCMLSEEYNVQESEKGRSTVEVRMIPQSIAGYLKMSTGEPVMILTSYINDKEENPLYISYEIIAGGRYRISI